MIDENKLFNALIEIAEDAIHTDESLVKLTIQVQALRHCVAMLLDRDTQAGLALIQNAEQQIEHHAEQGKRERKKLLDTLDSLKKMNRGGPSGTA
ncbi:MAG: hypothetical protein H0X25_17455 [Acidobacteriales bacterium]|nr:hypothetical protein [Terriglobales bacterium]